MKKLKAISKTQQKAYDSVIRAIKSAQKKGLVFYGKSGNLVAYTKQSDSYVDQNGFEACLRANTEQIENLSTSILQDSGADDYPSYINESDSPFYFS